MTTDTATVLPFPSSRTGAAPRHGRARVRLEPTRRGRRLMTALAFVLGLLVALCALFVLDIPSALAGDEDETGRTVTVETGDTLWGYAEQHAPEGVSEQEFIAQVRTMNHLPTGRLTAGQVIELPVLEGGLGD